MSFAHMQFFSKSLCRIVDFQIFLPNDIPKEWKEGNKHYSREVKNLFLLHGYSGTYSDWQNNSQIMELANQYNLAIVMPNGENSFYLDGVETGRKYATYVGEELPDFVCDTFHLSKKRADNFIGGYSMGGFGAIHTGFAYPEKFFGIFALSSALIMHKIEKMKSGEEDLVANYAFYRSIFGEPDKIEKSNNNPEELIRRLKKEKKKVPDLYMACGTEDFLLEENRNFHRFLCEQQVPHRYLESKGIHNFKFWNQYLEPALQWILEKNNQD